MHVLITCMHAYINVDRYVHTYSVSGNFSLCIISMPRTSTATPTHGRHFLLLIRFFPHSRSSLLFEKLFLNLMCRCCTSCCCCFSACSQGRYICFIYFYVGCVLCCFCVVFALYNLSCVAEDNALLFGGFCGKFKCNVWVCLPPSTVFVHNQLAPTLLWLAVNVLPIFLPMAISDDANLVVVVYLPLYTLSSLYSHMHNVMQV